MGATRWGICSAGKIAHDFLVALKTLPPEDHQVVAIASRDLSRAQEYAKIHEIPKAYGSYAELAEDPDVDIVHIGVVNPYHLPTTLLFIEAKKNVLCEKPMGMNAEEVKTMVQAAQQQQVFFMEGYWTRFFPATERIRSLLSQGSVGDVMVFHAEFGSPQLTIPRCVEKEMGGGGLLDIGGYCIQFASMIFNGEEPESITASGFLHDTGVDKTISIILNYSGQRQAALTCTMTAKMPNRASINGTKGMIEIPSTFWCPTELFVSGQSEKFLLPPPSLKMHFTNSTGLRYEAEHVRQCLRKGLKESPVLTHKDSLLISSILDEVRKQVGVSYPQDKAHHQH
ncbi:trans-1,2-dihydrobenzene-1,2-diol dehydrogenase [Anolis carolinensis]|uniref:Trans-1,2-dihydrobenzene-1,2-diol dehydrogenase n=1 Tax=Anolis carolinensis TaxID=28377 RepID=H9GP73_ANOCA|nr:PREDICTED: trans-1,2-dihydrobenzene-1,2-diol dehydrogenase [Anolis carolinensis]|eukprot:XP_003226235.1 PREDICTED: trans-1,2-dihydrobenzene-1,2-diol dehydrogenase [Anolis carolinensis]